MQLPAAATTGVATVLLVVTVTLGVPDTNSGSAGAAVLVAVVPVLAPRMLSPSTVVLGI